MRISTLALVAVLFWYAADAHGGEFSDYFAAGRHPICGSNEFTHRMSMGAPVGRPPFKSVTYELPVPKVCKHLMFGLAGKLSVAPTGGPLFVELPEIPEEYRVAIDLIYETIAHRVFRPTEPREFGLGQCSEDPNFPNIPSVECWVAIATLNRNDLLRVQRVAAIEVLDNFLGTANYKDQQTVTRIRLAISALKASQGDVSPVDVVEYLSLTGNLTQKMSPPRIQQFPTFYGTPTSQTTTQLIAPDPFLIKFDGTVTILTDIKAKSAAIQFNRSRLFWKPSVAMQSNQGKINGIGVEWCRRASDPQASFETDTKRAFFTVLVGSLDDQVSPQREIRLDGMMALLPLPQDDLLVERHWLCLQTFSRIPIQNEPDRVNLSFTYAHAPDAVQKGCKGNCL